MRDDARRASPSSTPATQHSLPPPICPQAATDVSAPPCVSVGVQQYQQSKQMYNVRAPMPGWLTAEAQSETQRIRETLKQLRRAQRQNPSAIESALRAAGMLSSGLVAYGPCHLRRIRAVQHQTRRLRLRRSNTHRRRSKHRRQHLGRHLLHQRRITKLRERLGDPRRIPSGLVALGPAEIAV
jgi:hypothetical protein